jgi:hypothetical protein
MNDWRQMLRAHDPATERLGASAAAHIRGVVVRAASGPPLRATWSMHVALAAFASVVLALSVFGTARRMDTSQPGLTPDAPHERRQIQFATPGGTRIIWELNPDFTLKETLP